MRFSVFALSAVPDLPTARRILGLDDLDDKSVTKVLFHQRKQQAGAPERLGWNQQMIASMTGSEARQRRSDSSPTAIQSGRSRAMAQASSRFRGAE